MDPERFPNFAIFEDEMIARQLDARIHLDDIDWPRLYLEMAGLSDQSLDLGLLGECLICFERKLVTSRPCCDLSVCGDCLKSYYTSLVSNAIVKIQCIGYSCDEYVTQDELILHLDEQMCRRFRQFLVDANKNPNQKTCPRCNHITDLDQKTQNDANGKKFGVQVACSECELVWCFRCQGPWHEALSCKDYQRGDVLFKSWTKRRHNEQANAQKCPKCKVFIQRSSGCDHMTCNRCSTNFCYQCGEKYRSLKFIGNHQSRLSIFGCKYRFKPEDPVKRRLIRGSIFGGKLLAAPVIGGLALGAGAVVLGVGLVALPFYGGYQLHKLVRRRRRKKMLETWTEQARMRHRVLGQEHEKSRQDDRFPTSEFISVDLGDTVPDPLYDIVEESDVEIEGFDWELNSDSDAEYFLYCDDTVHSNADGTHEDDLDSHAGVHCGDEDCGGEGVRDCGKSSFEADVVGGRSSFCALNSNCDSCDGSLCANSSFSLKNPGADDMANMVFMVKCMEMENRETESTGSTAEAGCKTQRCGVPVLIRRPSARSFARLTGSGRLAKNHSAVVDQKARGKFNQSGLSNRNTPCEGEYISPCDMVTHL